MTLSLLFDVSASGSYGTNQSEAAYSSLKLVDPQARGILTFIVSSTHFVFNGNPCAISGVRALKVAKVSGSRISATIELSIT
jgi:hypothetical protein